MNDKQKIDFADAILRLVDYHTKETMPSQIGSLNKIIGFNGFKKSEIGTPVFAETDDTVFIMIESLDGKTPMKILYNKLELSPFINFNK